MITTIAIGPSLGGVLENKSLKVLIKHVAMILSMSFGC
jgi:hypothetical protein